MNTAEKKKKKKLILTFNLIKSWNKNMAFIISLSPEYEVKWFILKTLVTPVPMTYWEII